MVCSSSNRDMAVHGTSCRVLMSVAGSRAAAQQNEILSSEIAQGPQVSVLKEAAQRHKPNPFAARCCLNRCNMQHVGFGGV